MTESTPSQTEQPVRPPDALDDFVPAHELAEFFGVSVSSIRNNLHQKGCPYYKFGIRTWYSRSQVAEWLKSRAQTVQS